MGDKYMLTVEVFSDLDPSQLLDQLEELELDETEVIENTASVEGFDEEGLLPSQTLYSQSSLIAQLQAKVGSLLATLKTISTGHLGPGARELAAIALREATEVDDE